MYEIKITRWSPGKLLQINDTAVKLDIRYGEHDGARRGGYHRPHHYGYFPGRLI